MPHSLATSTEFACAVASGADWREIGRKILESLDSVRTDNDRMNIGFIYATDALGGDVSSLLSLLRNVTGIKAWYGATGAGICGNGQSLTGAPAVVAMIGRMPEGSFSLLQFGMDDHVSLPNAEHFGATALMHGLLCGPAIEDLKKLREDSGIFSVGGFASGQRGGLHIANGQVMADSILSGALFKETSNMLVGTAEGCVPTGALMTITGCRDNMITSLDDEPAFDALRRSIEQLKLPPALLHDDDVQSIPAGERRGHIHAAFPVAGLDTGAMLVRNIMQADTESKTLSVSHPVERGMRMQFVYRDPHTALDGLVSSFQDLRDRAIRAHPQGRFEPKALLHFGCGARLADMLAGDMADEARLAARIFGPIPMAGFYTSAEICNGHVYGYTGVSILII